MSQRNVEIVEAAYAAFNRGDIAAVLAVFDPRITWSVPESLPFGGTSRGPAEVAAFFQKLPSYFAELRVEPAEFLATGDQVVVRGRHHVRAERGTHTIPFAMFWTLRDGKVVELVEYQDTAATLAAIGA